MLFLLAVCNYQLQLTFNLNFACNRARVIRTLAHTHTPRHAHSSKYTRQTSHERKAGCVVNKNTKCAWGKL